MTGDLCSMSSPITLETPPDRLAHVYKLDELGNTQWNRTYLPTGVIRKAIQSNDDNYILCGYYTPPEKIRLDAAILKLDSAGNLLWQRSYGDAYHEYAYDMIFEANDSTGKSGYVICGRKDLGTGEANVYFLKLNCMGLLDEPHAEFAVQIAPPGNDPLQIQFQNLSKYVYPDSVDGGFYLWDFGDGSTPAFAAQRHRVRSAPSIPRSGRLCRHPHRHRLQRHFNPHPNPLRGRSHAGISARPHAGRTTWRILRQPLAFGRRPLYRNGGCLSLGLRRRQPKR